MIIEALLEPTASGRFAWRDPIVTDAETLEEWLSDAAGGLTTRPAPELNGLIEQQDAGLAYKVTDASAPAGRQESYLIIWIG